MQKEFESSNNGVRLPRERSRASMVLLAHATALADRTDSTADLLLKSRTVGLAKRCGGGKSNDEAREMVDVVEAVVVKECCWASVTRAGSPCGQVRTAPHEKWRTVEVLMAGS
jgi:hypothetical protein